MTAWFLVALRNVGGWDFFLFDGMIQMKHFCERKYNRLFKILKVQELNS